MEYGISQVGSGAAEKFHYAVASRSGRKETATAAYNYCALRTRARANLFPIRYLIAIKRQKWGTLLTQYGNIAIKKREKKQHVVISSFVNLKL